ncbi:MAG TPA: hypothetical protein VF068_10005 [Rubrobacter sp.]
MFSPLGKLGRIFGRSFTFLGSLALKLGIVRRVLLLVAAVVILSSLLLTVLILRA